MGNFNWFFELDVDGAFKKLVKDATFKHYVKVSTFELSESSIYKFGDDGDIVGIFNMSVKSHIPQQICLIE